MAVTGTTAQRNRQFMSERNFFGTPGFYVAKLEEALGVVQQRRLTFPELLNRLSTIWADENRQAVLSAIEALSVEINPPRGIPLLLQTTRRLPDELQDQLATTLAELVQKADTLPARDRDPADRAVSRLSRLLTVERAWSTVKPWFEDRRAFRRNLVIRVLREHGVPPALGEQVIEEFRTTQDRNLLKLISENPHVASLLEERDIGAALATPEQEWSIGPYQTADGVVGPFVRKDSDARYWKMRAIEVLLIGGHVPSDAVAFERPMEFVWAVGRQSHQVSLPLLRRVLEEYKSDPEFVWRCTRALHRMGEPADIAYIRTLAEVIVQEAAGNQN